MYIYIYGDNNMSTLLGPLASRQEGSRTIFEREREGEGEGEGSQSARRRGVLEVNPVYTHAA